MDENIKFNIDDVEKALNIIITESQNLHQATIKMNTAVATVYQTDRINFLKRIDSITDHIRVLNSGLEESLSNMSGVIKEYKDDFDKYESTEGLNINLD